MLEIKNLHVAVDGKEILKGVNLVLEKGKVHALMGPNGSGKSTLSNAIMGHPKYTVTRGKILLNGEDITGLSPDERAKKGLFLSFQYPSEISGVTISNFIRTAMNAHRTEKINVMEFQKLLKEKLQLLSMPQDFASRYLNAGFSGGEKKKSEILQLALLNPKVAILDETDSGLDIDALKAVSDGINAVMNKDKTILIITHYKRILEYIHPDKLSIMIDGKIVLSGGAALVDQLEEKGYGWIEKE
ncbi:MAG: Fe-S cluster assembly ATPase SufC [Nanoarchaeota archaeon]